MEALLASAIAVVGTLLGSSLTFLFQRLTGVRAEKTTRADRLRQERLATYSQFAGASAELRRGVIALWFRRNDDARSTDLAPFHAEADRLGAAAEHARMRVFLVADDPRLVALADTTFEPITAIGNAADLGELREHEKRCEATLTAFMTAARGQIR